MKNMKSLAAFKKQPTEAPDAPGTPEATEEAESDEEGVSFGTKIKVVAALAVVGLATYVAYWVQEPSQVKVNLLEADVPAAAEQGSITATSTTVAVADLPGAATQEVTIIDFTFTPANLTVEAGTAVVWTNVDTVAHTVQSVDDFFASTALAPGESYSYTFTQEGEYEYASTFYPEMRGKINVVVSSGTSAAEPSLDGLGDGLDGTLHSATQAEIDAATELVSSSQSVTLDPQEFLNEPPPSLEGQTPEVIMLSVSSDQGGTVTQQDQAHSPDQLAKSGPEDLLYIGLFIGILMVTKRRFLRGFTS